MTGERSAPRGSSLRPLLVFAGKLLISSVLIWFVLSRLSLTEITAAMTHPRWGLLVAAFAVYGISALVWMIVLSRVNLSYAYPMVSLGYVFVVILSRYLFGESVTMLRLAGTLVIGVGVILISQS